MRLRRRTLVLLALIGAVALPLLWFRLRRPALPPVPTEARLQVLRGERDGLQAKLRSVVVKNGERSLDAAPRAGVMIGIPTSFTASVLEQVVTGLFGETTLTLRNLKVRKEGEVKAKMLVRKRTLGSYDLDLRLAEVQGLLKPGKPTLGFGQDQITLLLPVRLADGRGDAELRFKWDSKGVSANVVCGDVDVTRNVTGKVAPQDYEVRGSFAIAASGDSVLLQPRFPDLAVRVFPDPSEEAWAVVDQVVKEQRKGCEIALGKVDIKEKLGAILGRGFNVKIPQKIFKAIRLPAGVSQSLELQGLTLAVLAKPTGVAVTKDRLWYGADIRIGAKRPSVR